jgi:hypothetical protein
MGDIFKVARFDPSQDEADKENDGRKDQVCINI